MKTTKPHYKCHIYGNDLLTLCKLSYVRGPYQHTQKYIYGRGYTIPMADYIETASRNIATKQPIASCWYPERLYPVSSYSHVRDSHYSDVIMGASASQITSLMIVYVTVIQAQRSKEISKPCVTDLYAVNSSVTGGFPALTASKAENVSM